MFTLSVGHHVLGLINDDITATIAGILEIVRYTEVTSTVMTAQDREVPDLPLLHVGLPCLPSLPGPSLHVHAKKCEGGK